MSTISRHADDIIIQTGILLPASSKKKKKKTFIIFYLIRLCLNILLSAMAAALWKEGNSHSEKRLRMTM